MKKNKKHLLAFLFVLLTLSIFSLGLTASGQAIGKPDAPWFEDCVPGQIIVGIQDNLSISQGTLATANQGSSSSLFLGVDTLNVKDLTDMSEIISLIQQENGGNMEIEPQEYNGPQVLLLELASDSGEDMLQAIEILEQNPFVSHASPNYITRTSSNTPIIPNDPLYEYLWGMEKIQAPEAWDIWTGSRFDRESCPVKVIVADSGIDYTHPDLIGNVKASWGYDFINDDQDAMDDFGHGTHVAGTIGSVGNNNEGVVGVNWQVTMIPIKVFDSGGWGTWEALIEAIVYAETWKVPIVNFSGGGYYFDPTLKDVINNYSGLLIAAAGNYAGDNDTNPFYPASYDCDNIISVAASYYDDELCGFSNYGETTVDLAAPGDDILSTVPEWAWWYWWRIGDYYAYDGGTSMAAPHVAGTAALLWSYAVEHGLGLTLADIKDAILSTVDHSTHLEGYVLTEGRLNTYKALKSIIPSEIIITYDANGGSGEPSPQIGEPGVSINLDSTVPIRGYSEHYGFPGCEFLGWATTSDATTPEYQPGDPAVFYDNTILYAVWQGIDIMNVHYVDTDPYYSDFKIGFDLALLNIEPGTYDMSATLKVYHGIEIGWLQDSFVVYTVGTQILPFLFDDPQWGYQAENPYTIEVFISDNFGNTYMAVFFHETLPPPDSP